MSNPENFDPTPLTGAETDVSPLGRSEPKPEHEKTAAEDADPFNWNAIANDPDFAALKRAKRGFIIPATIFFLVYYMALPVLVGYWPEAMKQPVWGKMNWAYLFAFSQFFMTWIVCAFYVRAARKWDRMSADLLAKFH
ncbi:MAG TPA: DUF485 domain-containing protein [Chthoniobacteraceae bacterium]|nr:DUF485 domain-containing protein [Chthoniobacteraceae bacterium]